MVFNFMHRRFLLAVFFICCVGGISIFAQNAADSADTVPAVVDETQMILQEDNQTTPQQSVRSTTASFGSTLRAFFVLAFVLALAYFFLRFLRKVSGRETYESSQIKIIAGQTLHGQTSIQIIEAAGRVFILGVGENVNLITEVTEKEALDELKLQASRQIPKQNFAQLLRGKLALQGADPKVKTILNTEQQADRIRKLFVKKDISEKGESDSGE